MLASISTLKIGRRLVGKMLKNENYHPYKIYFVQVLPDDNFSRRLKEMWCLQKKLIQVIIDFKFKSDLGVGGKSTTALDRTFS